MQYKLRFINLIIYSIIFLWTLIIGSIVGLFIYENYTYADELAKTEAITSVEKDIAYRYWIADHGGVYVPSTEKTAQNPFMKHIPDLEITSKSNKKYTLINPSQALAQMMQDYSTLYGTKGHITSKMYLNPKNKPDSWEEKALGIMHKSGEVVYEKDYIEGEEYYRYIKPFVTEQACLKCHAIKGYKLGEVNGAVSVSIPMKSYTQRAYEHSLLNFYVLFFIYMIGLLSMLYGKQRAKIIIENKIQDYEQHIFSLVNIIEKRDRYTAGHTQRVAQFSVLIAEEMGYGDDILDDLYRASMLHDIGKISTPDSILLKPGKLTPLENEIIQEHVVVSYELLSEVDIYKDIAEIIRHHHEHYDGSGYPAGLKGDEIPMMSHIMTVADSFDAMTTNRIYKVRKSVETALSELESLAGKQFHSEVVHAAMKVLKGLELENTITQRPKTKIEKERFAYFYRDLVTGVYNKQYLEFVLAYNHEDEFNVRCAYGVYLHDFSKYNKEYSWEDGDKLLRNFAQKLDSIFTDDYVFRIHGDDFIVFNKEHHDREEHLIVLESILAGTGVTFSYKHIDIKERDVHFIEDLEKLL